MSETLILEKTNDEHVTSINRQVVSLCSSVKEGTSKLTNKLYYLYQQNRRKGIYSVLVSLETLKRELNRSEDSIRRYIEEAIDTGLIIVEKIRDKFHKLRYRFFLTEKLLKIKKCGTVVRDEDDQNSYKTVPNFYTQKPQNAGKKSQNAVNIPPEKPQKIRPCEAFLDPLYLGISLKRLNSAREDDNTTSIETFETPLSTFQEEQPKESDKEALEFLNSIQEINNNLPKPNDINIHSILKTYRNLKKSHFGGIDKAMQYLNGFSNNPFVMGKKPTKKGDIFNATLGYILSGKTIEQYWERKGLFDVWPPKESKQSFCKNSGVLSHSNSSTAPAFSLAEALKKAKSFVDGAVKNQLYNLLGETKYISWIENTGFVANRINNGEIEFSVNSTFTRDYINTHFYDQLRKAFESVYGDVGGKQCL
jgi:hypothetical protein